jgi:20S proteasome alpha/beta subunit
VTVATGDSTHQLVARIHHDAASDRFEAGDTVVVVRFQDGVALVAEPKFLS